MKMQISKNVIECCILSLAFACVAACQPAPRPSASVSPAPKYFVHTVVHQGETLGVIAAWYTGNADGWKAIADANPALRPTKILVGDKVKIPEALLKRRDALPARVILRKKVAQKTNPLQLSASRVEATKPLGAGLAPATGAASDGLAAARVPATPPTRPAGLDEIVERTAPTDLAPTDINSPESMDLSNEVPSAVADIANEAHKVPSTRVITDELADTNAALPRYVDPTEAVPTISAAGMKALEMDAMRINDSEVKATPTPQVPRIKTRDELLEELLK